MLLGLAPIVHLPWFLAAILTILACFQSMVQWRTRSRGRPLPPGPRRLPIIGNMFSMPTWKPWVGFRDLGEKYGKIMYLEVLGKPMLVLNSPDVMNELLEKHSAKTSSRAQTPLISLAGQAFNFAFLPYGRLWRTHRRMFWQYFNPGKMTSYWPVQREVTRKFLVKLLDKSADLQRAIQYTVTAATMKVTYGIDIDDEEDNWISVVDEAFVGLRLVTVSVQFLLEHFPIVRARVPSDYMLDVPFTIAKKAATDPDTASMVSDMLRRTGASGLEAEDEQIARRVTASAVEGGSDTTFSTIQGILLALSLNPDVQRKARAELDAVVGRNRLPDFEDRDALVYVNAIVKEGLRWHNVIPLGVGHCTTEDEELGGYFIPAGTVIVPNVWAVMHNPQYYPEPDKFDPDRFIRDGKLDPDVLDPASFVFGFGRRVCPGRHYAQSTLFITVASILHIYSIDPPLDERGCPVMIEPAQSHGFISYPEDCRCRISPRSKKAETLVRAAIAEKLPERS
ncbi:cytochrome P450 [Cubamyces lactineus]|nr:cytochrome P450 [Cubamyces lactineus]